MCWGEWKEAGMRIGHGSPLKKIVSCPLWVSGEILPQVEELQDLRHLFTIERTMDRDIDRWISALYALTLYQPVGVKKKKNPTLTTLPTLTAQTLTIPNILTLNL